MCQRGILVLSSLSLINEENNRKIKRGEDVVQSLKFRLNPLQFCFILKISQNYGGGQLEYLKVFPTTQTMRLNMYTFQLKRIYSNKMHSRCCDLLHLCIFLFSCHHGYCRGSVTALQLLFSFQLGQKQTQRRGDRRERLRATYFTTPEAYPQQVRSGGSNTNPCITRALNRLPLCILESTENIRILGASFTNGCRYISLQLLPLPSQFFIFIK